MREKTAEEKLREELEGDSSGNLHDKELVRKLRAKKSARTSNIGKKTDSFIDDFERKVEQSLNAGNIFRAPSKVQRHAQAQPVKNLTEEINSAVSETKDKVQKTSQKLSEPMQYEILPEPEPKTQIISPEILPEPKQVEPEPEAEVIDPEVLPEPAPSAPTIESELSTMEPEILSEPELPAVEPEILSEPGMPAVEPEILPEPELPAVEPEILSEPGMPAVEPEILPEPELLTVEPEILSEPEMPTVEPEILSEPELLTVEPEILSEPELPAVEPEILPEPELPVIEPEILSVPEQQDAIEITPDAEAKTLSSSEENENDGELPDIPVIEPEEFQDINSETENEILPEGELPDIPVIEDDIGEENEENNIEDEQEIYEADVENVDDEEPEPEQTHNEENEESEKNNVEDVGNEELEPEHTLEDTTEAAEKQENSLPADIVLNIDDELPILNDDYTELDPETETAPVTVTMPESTKTAEDKLMADIAEAMTGSPLNLDSPEAPAPYQLPENFLNANPENSDPSQQSAEDKLIANIAQAMNESPLDTAQDQVRQNLEHDLNPFDEINLPEPIREEPKSETEENKLKTQNKLDEQQEAQRDEHEQEQEQEFLPDFSDNDDNNTQKEIEAVNDLEEADPFTLNDEQENLDEPEIETQDAINEVEPENFDDEPEQETITELNDPQLEELMTNPEPEHEQDEDDNGALSLSPEEAIAMLADDDENDNDNDNDNVKNKDDEPEILTAEQRLQQEIANFSQAQPEQEINAGIISPENNIINTQKEVKLEKTMPEQSLLDENSQDMQNINEEIGDDWDISSLGELSEAASIPDDEPEDLTPQETPTTIIMNNPEQAEQEKTMGIREKLAERKNAASAKKAATSSSSSSSSRGSKGGILLPILLGLLLLLGGVIAWQLHQISDKITMAMMNSAGFESVSGFEAPPSYDYTIDFILDPNIAERMAARGREGWQVVGSRRTQDSTTGQYGYEFIFMRRRSGR